MAPASDFKTLCGDIITSYDLRARALGELVGDVKKTLKGLAADRKRNGEEQAKALARSASDLTKDVSGMIKSLQREHKAMAVELKGSLGKDRGNLEKCQEERLRDFKNMMGNVRKSVRDTETHVQGKLKEFAGTRADTSEELRKVLAREGKKLQDETRKLSQETKKLLASYRDDNEEMTASWQQLTETMAKKREQKPILLSRGTVRTAGEAVAGKRKGAKRGRKRAEGAKKSVEA